MEKSIYKLLNPAFSFEFGGKTFEVKKANLEMAIQYQNKVRELKDSKNAEIELASYCIYLVIKKSDPTVEESWVKENTPADIEFLDCLATLGFISQKRVEIAKKINQEVEKKLASGDFSASSLTKQDGPQNK